MNRRRFLIGTGGAAIALGAGAAGWRATTGSMDDYDAYAAALRARPTAAEGAAGLTRFAALAANGHNAQPWRFAVSEGLIEILPDESRRTAIVDPDGHHLYVSLGCAAENLAVSGVALGSPGEITVRPDDRVAAAFAYTAGPARPDPLFEAIARRQSTRALYDGRAIAAADLAALETAAKEPGVAMVLVTERATIDAIGELVVTGDAAQMADAAFMDELARWIRFSPKSAMASGDGLFSAASGNPVLPQAVGEAILPYVFTVGAENDRYAGQVKSTPAMAVFFAEEEGPAGWVKVGRACQRMQLAATARGLKHAFLNQPVEVAELRPALASLVGAPDKRPDLLMRFGHGPTLPYSPRRMTPTVAG